MSESEPNDQDLDSQYRCPSGEMGRRVGQGMAAGHLPENLWAIRQIAPQPTDHILEVGFGPGVAVEEIAEQLTTGLVAGIDLSQTMVDEAAKRNAEAIRTGRVDLRYGRASNLPFPDASFDKAFSVHSIYFRPEPVKVLQELQRVLKPGGLLAITTLPKDIWPPNAPGSELQFGTSQCTPYFASEVEQMMLKAGFTMTRTVVDEASHRSSNYSVLGLKQGESLLKI